MTDTHQVIPNNENEVTPESKRDFDILKLREARQVLATALEVLNTGELIAETVAGPDGDIVGMFSLGDGVTLIDPYRVGQILRAAGYSELEEVKELAKADPVSVQAGPYAGRNGDGLNG